MVAFSESVSQCGHFLVGSNDETVVVVAAAVVVVVVVPT